MGAVGKMSDSILGPNNKHLIYFGRASQLSGRL